MTLDDALPVEAEEVLEAADRHRIEGLTVLVRPVDAGPSDVLTHHHHRSRPCGCGRTRARASRSSFRTAQRISTRGVGGSGGRGGVNPIATVVSYVANGLAARCRMTLGLSPGTATHNHAVRGRSCFARRWSIYLKVVNQISPCCVTRVK